MNNDPTAHVPIIESSEMDGLPLFACTCTHRSVEKPGVMIVAAFDSDEALSYILDTPNLEPVDIIKLSHQSCFYAFEVLLSTISLD